MVFGGYLNRAPAEQPFFPGGWLDTGDLGRVDCDGYVWVTGRSKDLIKRGGHGIDPSTIEDALMAHPEVALAAAVGQPDSYAGEIPIAFVQLRPQGKVTPDELLDFVRLGFPSAPQSRRAFRYCRSCRSPLSGRFISNHSEFRPHVTLRSESLGRQSPLMDH